MFNNIINKMTGSGKHKTTDSEQEPITDENGETGTENEQSNTSERDDVIDQSDDFMKSLELEEPELLASEDTRITKLENELTESKDRLLRMFSEFENYKKRVIRERVDLLKNASEEIITVMLPVLDDFERAILSLEKDESGVDTLEGVRLIYNKMKKTLQQKGLEEMEAINSVFDSEIHDALTSISVNDEKQKGTVIEVIEKGYVLNGRVIRHAKVVIGS
jgi:molecular chaperone GrpE